MSLEALRCGWDGPAQRQDGKDQCSDTFIRTGGHERKRFTYRGDEFGHMSNGYHVLTRPLLLLDSRTRKTRLLAFAIPADVQVLQWQVERQVRTNEGRQTDEASLE